MIPRSPDSASDGDQILTGTIPATEAGGATGNASSALAAFRAGGSAVDSVDPSPTRLAPQVAGVEIGNLDVGTSTMVRLFFDVPATVTKFSITENGTVQDVVETSYSFSIGQAIIP